MRVREGWAGTQKQQSHAKGKHASQNVHTVLRSAYVRFEGLGHSQSKPTSESAPLKSGHLSGVYKLLLQSSQPSSRCKAGRLQGKTQHRHAVTCK